VSAAADAARLRRRALADVLAALGPRWVLVVAGDDPGPLAGEGRCATIALDDAPHEGVSARGAAGALPVASESATGVLVCAPADGAAACVRDVARILQPGGAAAFLSTWRAHELSAFDAVLAEASLETRRRRAVRLADAPACGVASWWPAWERHRAAAARDDERVECLVLAVRAGHGPDEMPTSGAILADLFVPRRWRARTPR
jgi:hypothetical protein